MASTSRLRETKASLFYNGASLEKKYRLGFSGHQRFVTFNWNSRSGPNLDPGQKLATRDPSHRCSNTSVGRRDRHGRAGPSCQPRRREKIDIKLEKLFLLLPEYLRGFYFHRIASFKVFFMLANDLEVWMLANLFNA